MPYLVPELLTWEHSLARGLFEGRSYSRCATYSRKYGKSVGYVKTTNEDFSSKSDKRLFCMCSSTLIGPMH